MEYITKFELYRSAPWLNVCIIVFFCLRNWEKLFSRSLSRSSSRFPEFNKKGTVVIRCPSDVAARRIWTTVIMLYVDYMDLRWPWKVELSSGSFCTYFTISSSFRDVQLLLRHMFMYGLMDSFVHWERTWLLFYFFLNEGKNEFGYGV